MVARAFAPDDELAGAVDAPSRVRLRSEFASLAALAFVSVVVPIVVASRYGALGVPRGDDWSYLRTLFTWVDGNGLNFNHWVSMTLVGQLVLAAPVAKASNDDIAAVQVLTAVLGFAGLCGVLALARSMVRRSSTAALVAFTIALGPLWAGLAATYMTDIPGVAMASIGAAFGLRALRDERVDVRFLSVAVALGCCAFSIREYAAIPTVAILVVCAWTSYRADDRRGVHVVAVVGSVALVAALAIFAFCHGVPAGKPFTPRFPTGHSMSALFYKGAGMLRLIGLWLAPLIIYARPTAIVRRAWNASSDLFIWSAFVVGSWLAVTGLAAPRIAFAGNYVVPNGFLADGVSAGHRPDLIPMPVFSLVILAGSVLAFVLVLAALPSVVDRYRWFRGRLPEPESDRRIQAVALTITIFAVGYAIASAAGLPLYDRYAIPIIPFVAVLVVRQVPAVTAARDKRRTSLRVAASLALLATLSVVYAADSASFDGSRWRVSQDAVHAGWAPREIGGNFEWVNWYAQRPGTYARKFGRFCVAVIVDPSPASLRRAVAVEWYTPPLHRRVRVAALRTKRPCAPALAPQTNAADVGRSRRP